MFHAHGKDKGATKSRYELWTAIKLRTGKVKKELQDKPPLRDELSYLWTMYVDLRQGCDKLGWVEIRAYEEATGDKLTAWESKLLLKIDKVRFSDG